MPAMTSRSPNGLTNCGSGQTMGAAGLPDPSWAHVYHNDFDTYLASDWTVAGSGASNTQALTEADGGQLRLSTSTGAGDSVLMQLTVASFVAAATKDVFFKFSGTLSEIGHSIIHAGLIATGATPLTANDGIFLVKTATTGELTLKSIVGGVTTSVALPAACAIVAATQFELGIHVTAGGDIEAYFNPGTGAAWQQLGPDSSSANAMTVRGPVAKLVAPTLTTAVLNPSFGLTNTSGVARTLAVDYVTAVRHR